MFCLFLFSFLFQYEYDVMKKKDDKIVELQREADALKNALHRAGIDTPASDYYPNPQPTSPRNPKIPDQILESEEFQEPDKETRRKIPGLFPTAFKIAEGGKSSGVMVGRSESFSTPGGGARKTRVQKAESFNIPRPRVMAPIRPMSGSRWSDSPPPSPDETRQAETKRLKAALEYERHKVDELQTR